MIKKAPSSYINKLNYFSALITAVNNTDIGSRVHNQRGTINSIVNSISQNTDFKELAVSSLVEKYMQVIDLSNQLAANYEENAITYYGLTSPECAS